MPSKTSLKLLDIMKSLDRVIQNCQKPIWKNACTPDYSRGYIDGVNHAKQIIDTHIPLLEPEDEEQDEFSLPNCGKPQGI